MTDLDRDPEAPAHDQLHVLRVEIARRVVYLTMLTLSIPRVIVSGAGNDAAVAMLVWSALGLALAGRAPRIPRAIVRRPRADRLDRWSNALLGRLGQLPLAPWGRPTSALDVWVFATEISAHEISALCPGVVACKLHGGPAAIMDVASD